MKKSIHLLLLVTAVAFSAWETAAQTNPVSTVKATDIKGQVVRPERLTAPDANITTRADVAPDRPERQIPPAVRSRIEQFKIEANRYLKEQQALKKRLEGANDEERERIREQRRALREKWLERAREFREQWKERQAELANKLASHREVLDSIRAEARDELRNAAQENRDRRGTD